MQLNTTISLQTSQGLRIYQWIMLNMPELWYLNSRKKMNRVTLTVWFWTCESLLMVATRSRDIQQTIGMVRIAWEGLKPGNWFTTFLEFFETGFLFCTPPTSLFLVCTCSLCIQECIRVTTLYQISPIMNIDSRFDPCAKSFQNKKIQSFSI